MLNYYFKCAMLVGPFKYFTDPEREIFSIINTFHNSAATVLEIEFVLHIYLFFI